MDFSTLTQFISTVGFPMAVAIWLMLSGDKARKENNAVITELTRVVADNTHVIEKLSEKLNLKEEPIDE